MSTIHEVARLAGVSTATVSRSFTASSALSDQTRNRVLEVADQLNYRPRSGKSSGSEGNSALVSVGQKAALSTTIGFGYFASAPSDTLASNGFYSAVLDGAQSEASDLGMHMLLSTTQRHTLTDELPQMVREQAVAGMLLVGTADAEILEKFVPYVPHIVLLDNRDVKGKHDSIFSDGFGGAYEATNHLLKLGHKQIGFLTERTPDIAFQDRLNGFVCAHFHAGVTVNPKHIVTVGTKEDAEDETLTGKDLRERRVKEIIEFLKLPNRPTAFMAANDDHAVLMMRACRALGISIPNEMSIVGFDDADSSSELDPPLTTVRVDMAAMGRAAVRRLHSQIASAQLGQKTLPPVNEQFPTTLIVRQSTAAPIASHKSRI